MRGETLDSYSKKLRKNMTDAEKNLWQSLRNREFGGLKFRRQHPISPFIVDFVCIEKKLIIELDGSQHIENLESDEKRSDHLRAKGYRVLRFWDNQVLNEKEAVLEKIFISLNEPPSP